MQIFKIKQNCMTLIVTLNTLTILGLLQQW